MAEFAIRTLEFDKVKELLSQHTATALGTKKAGMLQIAREFSAVKRLQEETAEAVRLLEDGKRFPFGGAQNVLEEVKRAKIGGVLAPEELTAVGGTITAIRQIKLFLQSEQEQAPILVEYALDLPVLPRLEKQIENTISEKGEILDSASTKLAGLRRGIRIAKERVRDKLDSILHDPNNQKLFQDPIVTMRGDRYVIPIKQEYKMNFPGVVHDQSGSGATLFIEPLAVVNLNNDVKKYAAEEKEEIERILRQLSGAVGAEADHLLVAIDVISNIDVICARAGLALKQKAVRPMIQLSGHIEIVKGRHPLLSAETVVPLDVELGGTFNTLLITGPNTGGKTVALKAVGLFSLMAQAGFFIPAISAKLPVFKSVFADIGDEQSIEQSLSTFSGHMTNIVKILKLVQPNDLVLIDELCAGTDPNEGAALAMAILEELHGKGVLTMITTHYSELKTFAYSRSGMKNASVEFDSESLRPTYRLLMGVPGSSNAFNISARLGLAKSIVENAGVFLSQEHIHMEDVLKELEGERKEYETRNKEINVLRAESLRLKQELEYQKKDFERKKNELLKKAREKADEIYRNSRRETEEIIKELKNAKSDFDAEQLRKTAEDARKKLHKSFVEKEALPEGTVLSADNVRLGQSVFLKTLAKNGVITGISGKDVTVQIGILKTTVKMSDCIAVSGKAEAETLNPFGNKRKNAKQRDFFVNKSIGAKTEIDVRGMTTAEAIPVVDKAIDDALLASMPMLRIIHGKGTGALRAGLLAYLSGHRSVKSIAEAPINEGGSGASIIRF